MSDPKALEAARELARELSDDELRRDPEFCECDRRSLCDYHVLIEDKVTAALEAYAAKAVAEKHKLLVDANRGAKINAEVARSLTEQNAELRNARDAAQTGEAELALVLRRTEAALIVAQEQVAKAVADAVAAEREACADVCDAYVKAHEAYADTNQISHVKCLAGDRLAASIRARGTK